MYGYGWRPYVPVAVRRRRAEKEAKRLVRGGMRISPVAIEGRAIATTFWGSSWCTNLERYSDFENRLPRGRTYVRNGSVMHLAVSAGEVEALVSGSEIYRVSVKVAPLPSPRWQAIRKDCSGSIDSLVELLQGRLSRGVMDRVCREGTGLFPSPKEIRLSCSCPDWADLCKHAAAALYGVGARLDRSPDLLFTLRGVDPRDLVAGAAEGMALDRKGKAGARALKDADLSAVFGIEMEGAGAEGQAGPAGEGTAGPGTRSRSKPGASAGTGSRIPATMKGPRAPSPLSRSPAAALGKKGTGRSTGARRSPR